MKASLEQILESIRSDDDGEAEQRAGSITKSRVLRHHLQVQDMLSGTNQRTCHHQHGADVTGSPEEELSLLVASFDPERVVHVGEDAGGLNLEDVCRHRAFRGDAHVLIDDGGRESSACTRRLTAAAPLSSLYIGILAGVSGIAPVTSKVVPAHLILTAVWSGFTLVNILAHACSLQLVPFRTDTAVGARLVDALPLTHVGGQQAFVHILAAQLVWRQLVTLFTLTHEGAWQVVAPVLAGAAGNALIHVSTVVELIWGESDWTLDRGQPGLAADLVSASDAALVAGGLVVATVTGHHGQVDEVWRGGPGRGGGVLLSITDDDLGVLWQTEVSTVVVDAAHPSFAGIWKRLALIDVFTFLFFGVELIALGT